MSQPKNPEAECAIPEEELTAALVLNTLSLQRTPRRWGEEKGEPC